MIPTIPAAVDAPGAVLYRQQAVQVDDVDARKGQVFGTVVPYERRVELVTNIFEEFAPGAFSVQASAPDQWSRVKLLIGHDKGGVPLGRAMDMREGDGLQCRFQMNMRMVNETERGREAWLALENGDLDEFSVGFRSVTRTGTITKALGAGQVLLRRVKAHLAEVSLVPYGAYGREAAVLSVRDGVMSPEEVRALETDPWAEERSRLAALRSTVGSA